MPATWNLLLAGLLTAQSTPADSRTRAAAEAAVLEPRDLVEVTDTTQLLRGFLATLTADALVLESEGSRVTIPVATIQRIDRVGDSLLSGTAIGAAVGGAAALALQAKLCTNNKCSDISANLDPRLTLFGALVGAGVGALIDSAFHGRKTVYRAGTGQAAPTMARPGPPPGLEKNGIVLFGHIGGAQVSDDEGSLGGGATAGAGAIVPIGRRFGVQIGYDRHTRTRDFGLDRGFFGTDQVITAKGLYFLRSTKAIRPYVGYGLTFIDSNQRSVSPTFLLGSGNQVLPGPLETFRSHTQGGGQGFAAGVDARVSARVSVLGDLTFDFTDNKPEGIGSTRLTIGAGWRF